jgi:hypothetical protein
MIMRSDQLHITQHKRFVPYGTHPNPALIVKSAGLVVDLNSYRV